MRTFYLVRKTPKLLSKWRDFICLCSVNLRNRKSVYICAHAMRSSEQGVPMQDSTLFEQLQINPSTLPPSHTHIGLTHRPVHMVERAHAHTRAYAHARSYSKTFYIG